MIRPTDPGPAAWTAKDTLSALGWFAAALAARAVLLARIEGVLDHDQAVVGLMAMDIAEGRRWPIFFDGQRYMGAIEAYTAAIFVKFFGHTALTVAMAPTFYFALLTAAQFGAWRSWSGRAAGHLAAAMTVACSPMMALWSIIPRGGYPEVFAWSVGFVILYRRLTRPGAARPGGLAQVAWGIYFALGYFINPLALVFYVAVAVDWTLGRHGADLRRERGPLWRWPDRPYAAAVWGGLAFAAVTVVAVGCHVMPHGDQGTAAYIFLLDLVPGMAGRAIGVSVVLATFGLAAWWTGLGRRAFELVVTHKGFAVGVMIGLSPFLLYNLRVRLGLGENEPSLAVWIRAPWDLGKNFLFGRRALPALLGGEMRVEENSFLALAGIHLPNPAWPALSRAMAILTPLSLATIAALLVARVRADRGAWRTFWGLRGDSTTSPTLFCSLGLASCAGLFLIQPASADGSSIRYLLPAWVFLPGLLATASLAWPKAARVGAISLLMGVWTASQFGLRAEMDRPRPEKDLIARLEAAEIRGIVAYGPLAILVADLSSGRVGAVCYGTAWPRLGDRYLDRLPSEGPIFCVLDLDPDGRFGPNENPVAEVRELSGSRPDLARLVDRVGCYEIWRLDMPLAEFRAFRAAPLPDGPRSAIVAR